MGKKFIDAEKLERHFKNCIDEVRNANGVTEDFENALTATKNQPSANVQEVRHGKWEECFEDWRHQMQGNKCSECGYETYGDVLNYNYCPHCGAKMNKEV